MDILPGGLLWVSRRETKYGFSGFITINKQKKQKNKHQTPNHLFFLVLQLLTCTLSCCTYASFCDCSLTQSQCHSVWEFCTHRYQEWSHPHYLCPSTVSSGPSTPPVFSPPSHLYRYLTNTTVVIHDSGPHDPCNVAPWPHTLTPQLYPRHATARMDLPRPRWTHKLQSQLWLRWTVRCTHGHQTHGRQTSARSGDMGGGSDTISACQWKGKETLTSTYFFNSADSFFSLRVLVTTYTKTVYGVWKPSLGVIDIPGCHNHSLTTSLPRLYIQVGTTQQHSLYKSRIHVKT